MSGIVVPINGKVPLIADLNNIDDLFFVRAVVKGPDKIELPESPLTLINQGNNFFCNYSLLMPELSFITAEYEVYNDGAFIELNESFKGSDVFTLDLESIKTIIAGTLFEVDVSGGKSIQVETKGKKENKIEMKAKAKIEIDAALDKDLKIENILKEKIIIGVRND